MTLIGLGSGTNLTGCGLHGFSLVSFLLTGQSNIAVGFKYKDSGGRGVSNDSMGVHGTLIRYSILITHITLIALQGHSQEDRTHLPKLHSKLRPPYMDRLIMRRSSLSLPGDTPGLPYMNRLTMRRSSLSFPGDVPGPPCMNRLTMRRSSLSLPGDSLENCRCRPS